MSRRAKHNALEIDPAFIDTLLKKSHSHVAKSFRNSEHYDVERLVAAQDGLDAFDEGFDIKRLRKRTYLYRYFESVKEGERFKNKLLALCLPANHAPLKKIPLQKNAKELSKILHNTVTKSKNYLAMARYKRRAYLRKMCACWVILYDAAVEEYLSEHEITESTQRNKLRNRYTDRFKAVVKEFNDLCYSNIVHFMRCNKYVTKLLDNKSEQFELNLARYDIFDKGKQYIGLIKVTERLFGVQTVYFLEVLFRSFDPKHMPKILLFLQDSVFHHLNFVLQFVDSVFFTTGAVITHRDKGFRRWSKVFFAMTFLTLATIPWILALLAIKVATIFFKITAVMLGMIKSTLDIRHYHIKRTKHKNNASFLKRKLGVLSELSSTYRISESEKNQAKEKQLPQKLFSKLQVQAQVGLSAFMIRRDLANEKAATVQNSNRITDKYFAIGISCISLTGMLIATLVPFLGYSMWISIALCVFFTAGTASKFFYRFYTFSRDSSHFEVPLHIHEESKVVDVDKQPADFENSFNQQIQYLNLLKEYYKLKQYVDKLKSEKPSKTFFSRLWTSIKIIYYSFSIRKKIKALKEFHIKACLYSKGDKKANAIENKPFNELSLHQQNARLNQAIAECQNKEKVGSKTQKSKASSDNTTTNNQQIEDPILSFGPKKMNQIIQKNSDQIIRQDIHAFLRFERGESFFENNPNWNNNPDLQIHLIKALIELDPSLQNSYMAFQFKRIENFKSDIEFYQRKGYAVRLKHAQNQLASVYHHIKTKPGLLNGYLKKVYFMESWLLTQFGEASHLRFLLELFAALPKKDPKSKEAMDKLKSQISYELLNAQGIIITPENADPAKRSPSMGNLLIGSTLSPMNKAASFKANKDEPTSEKTKVEVVKPVPQQKTEQAAQRETQATDKNKTSRRNSNADVVVYSVFGNKKFAPIKSSTNNNTKLDEQTGPARQKQVTAKPDSAQAHSPEAQNQNFEQAPARLAC